VTLAVLIGRENDQDTSYHGIAHWNECTGEFKVWGKSRGTQWEKLARFVDLVVKGRLPAETAKQLEVHEARRCRRCNRLLTTPESVELGMGPECANRS